MSYHYTQNYSFRGRGSSHSRGRGLLQHAANLQLPTKDIMDGLHSQELTIIEIPAATNDANNVEIRNCTYIGSYNWFQDSNPVIIVPGSPPRWTDRPLPYRVEPDRGLHIVAPEVGEHVRVEGGQHLLRTILWPLIAAVNHRSTASGHTFDWPSVDFITNRNSLRKLLCWAKGDAYDFRIDMQLAGDRTVLFNRWQERSQEYMSGKTFGFNFEKAATRVVPGCEGSTSHHRIVTYDLNGLKMVVRFEVDAFLPAQITATSSSSAPTQRANLDSVDNLTQMFSSTNVGSSIPKGAPTPVHGLTILEGGQQVSPDSLVEIKTRSEWNLQSRGFDWDEAYAQLWLSQTTNHMLAVHRKGEFFSIEQRRLSTTASKEEQPHLKKLRLTLEVIQQIVLTHRNFGKEGRLSLVCVGGILKVYKRNDRWSCLPQPVLQLFDSLT